MEDNELNRMLDYLNSVIRYTEFNGSTVDCILNLGDIVGQLERWLSQPTTHELSHLREQLDYLLLSTIEQSGTLWKSLLDTSHKRLTAKLDYFTNRIRTINEVTDYISNCKMIRFVRVRDCGDYVRVKVDLEEGFILKSDTITLDIVISQLNSALHNCIDIEME